MGTIFTKIINGDIPSYKIAENDDFYAFLDINPIQPGHTLVVPKHEVDYFFDLDDDGIGGIMVFAKEVAGKIKRATGCKRVAMVVLGMEVPHAHIHLIPINKEGDVDFTQKLQMSSEGFETIQAKITQS